MIILGINSYHPDSSACLLIDGKLVGAISEERLGERIKHDFSFPINSIKFLLNSNNLGAEDIDYIAIGQDKSKNMFQKSIYSIQNLQTSSKAFLTSIKKFFKVNKIKNDLEFLIKDKKKKIKYKTIRVEHHLAHTASSYWLSNFNGPVASLSFDGSGDFVSMMLAKCTKQNIEIIKKIYLPNSLGFFYTAITQFLGFPNYGDEYKVMGLAAHGNENKKYDMSKIIKFDQNKLYINNQQYIKMHGSDGTVKISKKNIIINNFYKKKIESILGKPRKPGSKITQRHKDIAKMVQNHFEEISLKIIKKLSCLIQTDKLCLSGGCALNGVLAGKISDNSNFKKIFIPPISSDDGLSIGAALYAWHNILKKRKKIVFKKPYLGPSYSNSYILKIIKKNNLSFKIFKNKKQICKEVSKLIYSGKVIGWFHGREELGQRALGNRSILANPAIKKMKKIVNLKIKKRETFRPFAPSILENDMKIFFGKDYKSPFMNFVFKVKDEWVNKIPSVVNVDGTARAHSVKKTSNKLFYNLILEFKKLSGIGMLLNTSFNENEPIVSHPQQAIDCFLRTDLDYLSIGNFLIKKNIYKI